MVVSVNDVALQRKSDLRLTCHLEVSSRLTRVKDKPVLSRVSVVAERWFPIKGVTFLLRPVIIIY